MRSQLGAIEVSFIESTTNLRLGTTRPLRDILEKFWKKSRDRFPLAENFVMMVKLQN
ncbi:hypothetical protein CKA32_002255 [Geitlerinema sp. FC II]|nr:hypothetical protein CKA32_002255 [Geitlerinema sp. FC II]